MAAALMLVLGGTAWAGKPPKIPPDPGGLPVCTEKLQLCQEALAICEASSFVLPGDGQDNGTFPLPPPSDVSHGPPLSYQVCGDGTIADLNTGLLWEQKLASDDLACVGLDQANRDVRCVDNSYTWTDAGDGDLTDADGTAFTEFLATLNGSGFAGSTAWRMPNVKELHSIVEYSVFSPNIDPDFGPTRLDNYWSATSDADDTNNAWYVSFGDGDVRWSPRTNAAFVRAVRSGSCPTP